MRLALVAVSAAALAALAGCNSPVPASPDTAWTVNMNGTGSGCNLGQVDGAVGVVNDSLIQQRVTDGMSGATVTCSVTPAGSGFAVEATASQAGSTLNMNIASITSGATMASPATGSISFENSMTVNVYSGACNFYFSNAAEGVAAGKIWVTYDCMGITYGGSSPPATCGVSTSVAAFENCTAM